MQVGVAVFGAVVDTKHKVSRKDSSKSNCQDLKYSSNSMKIAESDQDDEEKTQESNEPPKESSNKLSKKENCKSNNEEKKELIILDD